MSASCVQHIPRTYAFSSPVQKTMFIDGRYLAPGLGRVCHVSPETALRGKQQAIPGANTRSHPLPRVFRALHERIINLVCSPRTRARIGRPAAFARTREASGACVSRQPASQHLNDTPAFDTAAIVQSAQRSVLSIRHAGCGVVIALMPPKTHNPRMLCETGHRIVLVCPTVDSNKVFHFRPWSTPGDARIVARWARSVDIIPLRFKVGARKR